MTVTRSDRVWFGVHIGFTCLLAALLIAWVIVFFVEAIPTPWFAIQQLFIMWFVLPGALLSWLVNSIILGVRKPRRILRSDQAVVVILAVCTIGTFATIFDSDVGLMFAFIAIPLLILAGIASTIVIAIGSSIVRRRSIEGEGAISAALDGLYQQPAP